MMIKRGKGHIVSVASAAGLFGSPGMVDYGASKSAAIGLMLSLRQELHAMGHFGVHTTIVCPGFIATGMFEGWRLLLPSVLSVLEVVATIMPMCFFDWFIRITKTSRAMKGFKQTRKHALKHE
ncbi:unnamed protein product [Peronospora destructor]|uniref:Uncharacterized protein n=1 Tax=Peronospora destructor TaxID=86335 RepID=A0AAV0T9G9_9STRA|nr:unnamed protein product [Peronospora destructor]